MRQYFAVVCTNGLKWYDSVVYKMSKQDDVAAAQCSRVGQIHYMRGVNFTADYWIGMKHAIRDTILRRCGHEVITNCFSVRAKAFNNSVQQVLECTSKTTPIDEHFAAMELLLRFVLFHMKSGYLRCAVTDNHD